MSDLAGFLAARLAEDEAAANAWLPFGNPDAAAREHVAKIDPGRVLREVAGKWKILAEHNAVTKLAGLTGQELGFLGWYREWVLKNLASAYSDHPDFDQAWSAN